MKRVQGVPLPLGVTFLGHAINFSIAVKSHCSCKLLLYRTGETAPEQILDMPGCSAVGEVRYIGVDLPDNECYEYNYLIDGQVVVDPYVKAVSGKEVWGEKADINNHEVRGRLFIENYDWGSDKLPEIPYHEVIAYALHIRGFTKHLSSAVKHKGTFQGVIEKIPYLEELGINQIQCMPVYEFEECMKYTNYWGYGEAYFFAPKSSYAASSNPVKELKDMVAACHQAQIEVVLELPFTDTVSTQIIEACLRYYVMFFHVDGFILNPEVVPMGSIYSDPILKSVKIMIRRAEYQNVMRRFLKGDEGMVQDIIGNIRHISNEDGVFQYMASHDGFTLADVVSYDGKHNEANGEHNQDGTAYNYSWNCGAEGPTRKKSVMELRKRQLKNAFILLLTSQGTPCILAGDEFGNTQNGNNNAYCQDNETSWLNWRQLKKAETLFTFVKSLIAFRKAHPVLHREKQLLGMDRKSYGIPDVSYHGENAWQTPVEVASRQLGVMYCGECAKDVDCFIAYNLHWLKHSFALPTLSKKKKWYKVMDTSGEAINSLELVKNQKEIVLGERTIVVLIGR